MSTAPRQRRPQIPEFDGIPAAAFAFFATLAQDNTRRWFAAHAETYRVCVDRPWRALITSVAAAVGDALPDLDTAVKTGHVLCRVPLQWPRPGAAYRTGLRAAFAPPEGERRSGACLFVSLDASGIRAGTEVAAGTTEWDRVLADLEAAEGAQWGERWGSIPHTPSAPLCLTVAGARADPAQPAGVAVRMRTARRGASLRWAAFWPADDTAVQTAALAATVWVALRNGIPLYLWATGATGATGIRSSAEAISAAAAGIPKAVSIHGTDGGPGTAGTHGVNRAGAMRRAEAEIVSARTAMERSGPEATAVRASCAARRPSGTASPLLPAPVQDAARVIGACGKAMPDIPPLPLSLRRALAARAEAEGVDLDTFILFALTQSAVEPRMHHEHHRTL